MGHVFIVYQLLKSHCIAHNAPTKGTLAIVNNTKDLPL